MANKKFYDETDEGIVAAVRISQNDDTQMEQLVADYSAIAATGSTALAAENFIYLAHSLGVSEARWKALANVLM